MAGRKDRLNALGSSSDAAADLQRPTAFSRKRTRPRYRYYKYNVNAPPLSTAEKWLHDKKDLLYGSITYRTKVSRHSPAAAAAA